jgi:3-oxoacyl-[acyl-carrier-protein] synthase III
MNNEPSKMNNIGIRSLAVSFPSVIRTNNYWLEKYPELVTLSSSRKRRARSIVTKENANGLDIWSQEVAPYLADPFRGNVERRILGENESSLVLECRAARDALEAAQLDAEEVDLAIVASMFPDRVGMGNAVYLAQELGLKCPAWNLESTCSSALVALQNARALIQTGEYRNALVVVSQIGSNSVDEKDSLSWSMGDAAGAFVVDFLKSDRGILGSKIVSTGNTCGAYAHELITDEEGKSRMLTKTGENASALAETAVDFVRECCQGAVAAAGVTLGDIDFFAFNTPTAWYANVCAKALGIDSERTIDLYPYYANIGPVFPIANLYHAAVEEKIRDNSLVLVYSNGASATAAAMVMRWGDVALGKYSIDRAEMQRCRGAEMQRGGGAEGRRGGGEVFRVSISQERVLTAEPEKKLEIVEIYLKEWLSSSLQLPVEKFDSEQPLTIWLDSLLVFLLRSRIEKDLEVRVPIENFFGDNNLASLTQRIFDRLILQDLKISESVDRDSEREKLSF